MKKSDAEFTVTNVLKVVPERAFQKSYVSAFKRLGFSLVFFAAATALLTVLPAYLCPFGWFIASLAYTSLFAIAHDCSHGSFFPSRVLNNLVGAVCLIPIFYPVEAWKLHHNEQHARAPARRRTLGAQKSKSFWRLFNPIMWPSDLAALVMNYYDLSHFTKEQQTSARLSVLFSYLSVATLFPFIVYTWGPLVLVNVWLMPWIGFHFWKNTLRQALPAVRYSFFSAETNFETYFTGVESLTVEEHLRKERLTELTHYSYPRFFELLCHDINLQVPHYLSTDIPCYNLRLAHDAILKSRWEPYVSQLNFGWGLLKTADSIANRQRRTDVSAAPESDPEYRKLIAPWYRRINWLHVPLFIFTHGCGLYALCCVPLSRPTFIWAFAYYAFTGLGITAGYHRLWAHRAYDAAWPVRFFLMLGGTGAVEGSIRWWSRDHRVHHRYTDTDKDPYNARRGFFYSHMGWMLLREDHKKLGRANIDDLNDDRMVSFQHKFYLPMAILWGLVVPSVVAGYFWGDYAGGFFWAGIVRLNFVHHATFCVNSLAHMLGNHTYDDTRTPRDHFITALITLGEGYHNFHHEFPKDYRNAIKFWQYDPTKWVIRTLAFFGLTYNLHQFPDNEVRKGCLQMKQKHLEEEKAELDWGREFDELPTYTWEEIKARQETTGELWMVIGGAVHDVTKWVNDHPGGPGFIRSFVGKDCTKQFNGAVYNHSNAGRNLLATLRVGRVAGVEPHSQALAASEYFVNFRNADDSIASSVAAVEDFAPGVPSLKED